MMLVLPLPRQQGKNCGRWLRASAISQIFSGCGAVTWPGAMLEAELFPECFRGEGAMSQLKFRLIVLRKHARGGRPLSVRLIKPHDIILT